MGKGNERVFGDYEGLYYVDYDYFTCYVYDEETDTDTEERDYDLERYFIEESVNQFKSDFKKRFKSFKDASTFVSNGELLLENGLFEIVLCDNEWSMCFKLLQKDSDYNIENLQSKHYQTYLDGMRDALFNQFATLGIYGGAWISGRIERPKDFFKEEVINCV